MVKHFFLRLALGVSLFFIVAHQALAQSPLYILYVTPTGAGAKNGTDWQNAYEGPQLQLAIDNAGTYAINNLGTLVMVWVAAGTYKPTTGLDRTISFSLKNRVAVYGGFRGTESSLNERPAINAVAGQPSSSTLSGEIGDGSSRDDNSYTVVRNVDLGSSTRLDGFVIMSGHSLNQQGDLSAGMLNDNSSPTLANLTFGGNWGLAGGGMQNRNQSNPSLTGCEFKSNAGLAGGAIFNKNSNPTLLNCSFKGNAIFVFGIGGGIYNEQSSPEFINCLFSQNMGGGIYNSNSSPSITNCSFSQHNALFGSVLNNNDNSNTRLTNCILWDNGGNLAIDNFANSQVTATNCLIEPGETDYSGSNNRTLDPLFVNATDGDLRLQNCSPAIDAGLSGVNFSSFDPDNNQRRQRTIDIGAFEFQATPTLPAGITGQPASGSMVCVGQTVTMNVSTTGTVTAYQWYKGSTLLSSPASATTATLTLPNVTTANTGTYYVVITSACTSETITSTSFSLQVNLPVTITRQPPTQATLCTGRTLTISVAATGSVVSYQWYKDGSPLSSPASASTAALTLTNLTTVQTGSYYVVITSACLGETIASTSFNLTVNSSAPRTVFVTQTGTGNKSGDSWPNALPGINFQAALESACPSTTFLVGAGLYTPTTGTDRTVSFSLLPDVHIYGGFLGNEASLSQRQLSYPSSTTLSGDIGQANNSTDNSFHVFHNVGSTVNSVLDGMVITGGNATDALFPNSAGGGMYNNGQGGLCSPTLRNCLFLNNQASLGGALYNDGQNLGNSSPLLINCAFLANSSSQSGGAIVNFGLQGISSPQLVNCSFRGNSAGNNMGSVLYSLGNAVGQGGASQPQLVNCVLFGNDSPNSALSSSNATPGITYSLLETGMTGFTGSNNLTTDTSPFIAANSIALQPCSAATNAGTNQAYQLVGGPPIDLMGNPRIYQSQIDMGAYEYQSQAGLMISAGTSLAMANVGVVVSLTATGGSTYQWVAPSTAPLTTPGTGSAVSASLTTAGVHTFTVVASSGACSQTVLVSVTALSGPDLTAVMSLPDGNFSAGETKGLLLQLQEVNGATTNGSIRIAITVPVGYSVSFDNTLTSINVAGGTINPVMIQNNKWQISSSVAGQQLSLTINSGESIGANSTLNLGFTITRTNANSGSVSNITVNVADDGVGQYDVNRLNNVYARIITGL